MNNPPLLQVIAVVIALATLYFQNQPETLLPSTPILAGIMLFVLTALFFSPPQDKNITEHKQLDDDVDISA